MVRIQIGFFMVIGGCLIRHSNSRAALSEQNVRMSIDKTRLFIGTLSTVFSVSSCSFLVLFRSIRL